MDSTRCEHPPSPATVLLPQSRFLNIGDIRRKDRPSLCKESHHASCKSSGNLEVQASAAEPSNPAHKKGIRCKWTHSKFQECKSYCTHPDMELALESSFQTPSTAPAHLRRCRPIHPWTKQSSHPNMNQECIAPCREVPKQVGTSSSVRTMILIAKSVTNTRACAENATRSNSMPHTVLNASKYSHVIDT